MDKLTVVQLASIGRLKRIRDIRAYTATIILRTPLFALFALFAFPFYYPVSILYDGVLLRYRFLAGYIF